MRDPQLPLGHEDLWPDRLPPGAGCFAWFLPPVDWKTLHERIRPIAPLSTEEVT